MRDFTGDKKPFGGDELECESHDYRVLLNGRVCRPLVLLCCIPCQNRIEMGHRLGEFVPATDLAETDDMAAIAGEGVG